MYKYCCVYLILNLNLNSVNSLVNAINPLFYETEMEFYCNYMKVNKLNYLIYNYHHYNHLQVMVHYLNLYFPNNVEYV
uniref:Uncharacterized protein n=1 Tax=Schistosoma curassoni TaxID=6186 RepID=A0A183KZ77_9TREM